MFQRIKRKIKRKEDGKETHVSLQSLKLENVAKTVNRYEEAITFAEADLHDYAKDLVYREEIERTKILVVGHDDTFSKPLIDYSVGMAERMRYEIIALNVSSIGSNPAKFLSPFKEKIKEDFETSAEKGFEHLKKRAEEKGIKCTHLIKFGDFNNSIKQVHEEIRRIEFVLTEPDGVSGDESVEQAIPVFSMVNL